MNTDSRDSHWEKPEVVSNYTSEPVLFRGERLAFERYYLNGLQGQHVLEIGCGGGRVTHFLHKMGASVVAVDISENMINAASAIYPEIEFRVMNAESLGFEEESFDLVVFSFNGLDCLYPKDARMRALQEVFRVLRPGGNFVFSHHNLSALLFGWYRTLRPHKLVHRARHVMNGDVFKREVYIEEADFPGLVLYYAHGQQVVEDLNRSGFSLAAVLPNTRSIDMFQKLFKTSKLAEWTDPWPYYVFSKPH